MTAVLMGKAKGRTRKPTLGFVLDNSSKLKFAAQAVGVPLFEAR